MKFTVAHNDQAQLRFSLKKALNQALQNISQNEPQLIANIVYHIPKAVNSLKLSFPIVSGGIFVHQQPQVICKNFPTSSPQSVEIGDLLLLRSEIRRGTGKSTSALLLQAKKIDTVPISGLNANQHHLYSSWPSFEYIRSTAKLNGKRRHITGMDLYNAGKYLLIFKNSAHAICVPTCFLCECNNLCLSVLSAQPQFPKLGHYYCFLKELVDFILGDAGKPYNSPPPKWKRNWDRVINDLIDITAKRASVFIRKASGGTMPQRGQYLCFVTERFPYNGSNFKISAKELPDELTKDGPPLVPLEKINEEDSDGVGISVIEFVVSNDK